MEIKLSKTNNSTNGKKISFFGALSIVLGASIGAGIFFKSKTVLDGAGNNLIFAIFSWLFACFVIVAMAFALIEIASASKKSNLSLISWNKIFNSNFVYQLSKNFIIYLYLPFTYFVMPVYFVQMFQDSLAAFTLSNNSALASNYDWVIVLIATLAIFYYFLVVGLNTRVANIHNQVILAFKFLPIIIVVILGFVFFASNVGNTLKESPVFDDYKSIINKGASLEKTLPGVGMFLAMAAIFFTYEGFFTAAGLQSEMKQPHKTPYAILLGIGITTIIYLLIAIATSIVGNGSIVEFLDIAQKKLHWSNTLIKTIIGTTNLFVAISILGIINSFTMWGPRALEELIQNGEIKWLAQYKDKTNLSRPLVSTLVIGIVSTFAIIVLFLIGVFGFTNSDGNYGQNLNNLYAFADISGNWSALITFFLITIAIYGGIKNRKSQKVQTTKVKYFHLWAWISIIATFLILFFAFAVPIIDLFLLIWVDKNLSNYHSLLQTRVTKVVVLIVFVAMPVIPILIGKHKLKKQAKNKIEGLKTNTNK